MSWGRGAPRGSADIDCPSVHHAIPNKTPFLPLNIYIRTYIYIKRSATKIDDKKCERKLIEKEV